MHVHERNAEKKRLNGLMLKSPMKVYRAFDEICKEVFADGALSKKHEELSARAVAVSQTSIASIDHRVEEFLDQPATDADVAETRDIAVSSCGALPHKF